MHGENWGTTPLFHPPRQKSSATSLDQRQQQVHAEDWGNGHPQSSHVGGRKPRVGIPVAHALPSFPFLLQLGHQVRTQKNSVFLNLPPFSFQRTCKNAKIEHGYLGIFI